MPTLDEMREIVAVVLGERAQEVVAHNGSVIANVALKDATWVLTVLRDDERTQMNALSYMTAVDYSPRTPRFEMVYDLYSTVIKQRVRVKYRIEDTGNDEVLPEAPSMHEIYLAAIWHERECYDLMGIRFTGHPDPRRILLADRWDGHPLRKDYPYDGKPVWKLGTTVDDAARSDVNLGL
jgi:NADH-quinone oxidoreductase subunit C